MESVPKLVIQDIQTELNPDWVSHSQDNADEPDHISIPQNPLQIYVGSEGLTDWVLDDYENAMDTAEAIAEEHGIAVNRYGTPDNAYCFCFDLHALHFDET